MHHHFRTARHTWRTAALPVALGAALIGALSMPAADATVAPGTHGKDVTFGADDDNGDNEFIQPPGVQAKQHMANTDIVFGRGEDDLLVGRAGSDTLIAGPGADILVGGPERGQPPNGDVLLGEAGDDVNVWAPGDGSDAFLGDSGNDTMIFAPLVLDRSKKPALKRAHGRLVPQVTAGGQARFGCTIIAGAASRRLGFDHLVRFTVGGKPVATVRQRGVERVICPSPRAGYAKVAQLTQRRPRFAEVRLRSVGGVPGAIVNR